MNNPKTIVDSPFSEALQAQYRIGQVLGYGAMGAVYPATRLSDGAELALKVTLRPGDWIIESDGGILDGRLAVQLEEAARILMEPDA